LSHGAFPCAQNSVRFLGCEPFAAQPFVVAGVPFDGAVTNRPGARFGPQEIRRASLMLFDATHPVFDLSPTASLGDGGDMRLPNASALTEVRQAIEAQASAHLLQAHPVFLGGDHSITLPLLRAMQRRYGPVALVHFDAHCDTWSDHFGEPSGHGTWTYEAIQEGLVDPVRTVQIGIRSSAVREAREYVADQGGMIYTARALRGCDGPGLQGVIDQIRQRIGDHPCYLTFDIDCLDPSVAPGTGTPEPGGLSSSQALCLLEGLAPLHFVGMDCVEVCPAYDHAELTSLAAAHLIWTYLSGRVAARHGVPPAPRSQSNAKEAT